MAARRERSDDGSVSGSICGALSPRRSSRWRVIAGWRVGSEGRHAPLAPCRISRHLPTGCSPGEVRHGLESHPALTCVSRGVAGWML